MEDFIQTLISELNSTQWEKAKDLLAGLGDLALVPMIERLKETGCSACESLHLADLIAMRNAEAIAKLEYNYDKFPIDRRIWWSYIFVLLPKECMDQERFGNLRRSYHNLSGAAADMALIAIARIGGKEADRLVETMSASGYHDRDRQIFAHMVASKRIPLASPLEEA